MTCNLHWFSLFHENMKVILWSIHTFWYKGLAQNNERKLEKKRPLLCKNNGSDGNTIFTKGSSNLWTWHLYNVFRSAKSIKIQPINPNLINQQTIDKKTTRWFEISRIFHIWLPIAYLQLPMGMPWAGAGSTPLPMCRGAWGRGRPQRGLGGAIGNLQSAIGNR